MKKTRVSIEGVDGITLETRNEIARNIMSLLTKGGQIDPPEEFDTIEKILPRIKLDRVAGYGIELDNTDSIIKKGTIYYVSDVNEGRAILLEMGYTTDTEGMT